MIVERWARKHPVFGSLEGGLFEAACERLKQFGLGLYEASGYRPMTHIESMEDEDIGAILADIGGLKGGENWFTGQGLHETEAVQTNKRKGEEARMVHIFFGKFTLGQVVATPGAYESVSEEERISALTRHINGEWGDLCEEDKRANDEALKYGGRLLSAYRTASGVRFWIITEHDRSVTTFLLPEEY